MKQALITGGQGYIGTHLAKSILRDKNWAVTTFDSNFSSKKQIKIQSTSRLMRHSASVVNSDAVARAMREVDVVYHLAARMDWNDSYKQPVRLVNTNVVGTAVVLAMAKRAGVEKVVFVSSAAVYGNIVGATENDSCVPVNMYGATKLASEAICRGFYNLGMEIVILRFYNVWGGEGSESVVNKFIDGSKVVYGDGDQTRDFIHITDVVKVLMKARDWDPAIYNIGTGVETTINGLWVLVNGSEVKPSYERPPGIEIFRSCADMEYTFRNTSWRPEVFLHELGLEGIKGMCE